MGSGASAVHDGTGLRELNEKFEKKMEEAGQKAATEADVDVAKDVISAGDVDREHRSNNRGWTVSVGSSSLRPPDLPDDRSAKRSHTTPASMHRRESEVELSDEDLKEMEKRQEFLKGRVRRGSVFLGEVLVPTLVEFFQKNATVHFYGRLGCNKPFVEADIDGSIEGFSHDPENIENQLKIGLSSTKGKKGGSDNGPNQDNFSVTRLKNGIEIYCVMDGHGKCGHNVSYRTVRTMPYYVANSVFYPDEMDKALLDAFELCQLDVMGNSLTESYDAQGSGTTATAVVRKGNSVWTAHCGDSRVALGDPNSKVLFETKDHKPDDKEEQERIERTGGEVRSFKYEDDWTVHRMFIKGRNYPGLCMSRSLGDDCVKEHGVTAIPDVKKIELAEGQQTMIIMASDGVWEFLDTSWVMRAVLKAMPGKGLMKCAKKLTREAKHRWKDEEGDYCDDITACLIKIG
jgi:serine/threonine protein phosphatase PrpC